MALLLNRTFLFGVELNTTQPLSLTSRGKEGRALGQHSRVMKTAGLALPLGAV